MAQIPTTATVDPKAAEQVKVSYTGNPEFKPIEGTSLEYAVNTPEKVIKDGDVYYLCLQGVWFTSPQATGAWTTATSVPPAIYTIPPSSPVYNVTYVTQSATPDGTIQASYTAGYFGTFIAGAAVGAILASGTGYYYPPYYGYPVGAYPIYRPYPCTYGVGAYYNTYTGAYGVAHGVYGPYHGAAAGAAYNPYTGTYARGATAYGPYGSRSAAQAYNPYTGTYAATRQGSSPYGSWGQSVVSNGNKSAYTQHYSNANGTVGSIQGSQGGAAAGASTKYGDTAVGKTSSGNMYAAHDGNVYKNTGNGWSSYDNGSWNPVNSSKNAQNQAKSYQNAGSNQAAAQQRAQSTLSVRPRPPRSEVRGQGMWTEISRTAVAENIRVNVFKAFSVAVVIALVVTAALAAADAARCAECPDWTPSLPGEEALYGWINSAPDAAAKNSEIKQTLTATAVERDLITSFFGWQLNGRFAGNGWNSPTNNAQWGTDYLNRAGTAGSNMYDNKPTRRAHEDDRRRVHRCCPRVDWISRPRPASLSFAITTPPACMSARISRKRAKARRAWPLSRRHGRTRRPRRTATQEARRPRHR